MLSNPVYDNMHPSLLDRAMHSKLFHNICLGRLHILDRLAEIEFFKHFLNQFQPNHVFFYIAETSDA